MKRDRWQTLPEFLFSEEERQQGRGGVAMAGHSVVSVTMEGGGVGLRNRRASDVSQRITTRMWTPRGRLWPLGLLVHFRGLEQYENRGLGYLHWREERMSKWLWVSHQARSSSSSLDMRANLSLSQWLSLLWAPSSAHCTTHPGGAHKLLVHTSTPLQQQ